MIINVHEISAFFKALRFASEKHLSQRRKGAEKTPYINHLIETADLIWSIGDIRDITTITAAVLHDILEDTKTTRGELEAQFGAHIASIVSEVTDDKTLPDAERKHLQVEHASTLSIEARLVKLADKISNIREIVDSPPSGWTLERRRAYVEWGARVVNEIRETNLRLERHFDTLLRRAREHFLNEEHL